MAIATAVEISRMVDVTIGIVEVTLAAIIKSEGAECQPVLHNWPDQPRATLRQSPLEWQTLA